MFSRKERKKKKKIMMYFLLFVWLERKREKKKRRKTNSTNKNSNFYLVFLPPYQTDPKFFSYRTNSYSFLNVNYGTKSRLKIRPTNPIFTTLENIKVF